MQGRGKIKKNKFRTFFLKFVTFQACFLVARPALPPLVGCPRLLIQYFCSYPLYLEAVCDLRNLRTRHGLVMRTRLRAG
jgi:hypothetical protein